MRRPSITSKVVFVALVTSIYCVRGEGVQGVLTLFGRGKAQVCHDLRVVELQGTARGGRGRRGQTGGKGRRKGRSRIKESAP